MAANERDEHRHSSCRGHEVLHGQAEHLRQVAERRLAAVALPVRVRREADCRIPRKVRGRRRQPLRIQQRDALQSLNEIDDEEADDMKEEHRDRVGGPRHLAGLAVGRDARGAIQPPLERSEELFEERAFAPVDARHVAAQRLHQRDEDDEIERQLRHGWPGHENASGLSRATNR